MYPSYKEKEDKYYMKDHPFSFIYSPFTSIFRCMFVLCISILLVTPYMGGNYQPIMTAAGFYPFAWAHGTACSLSIKRDKHTPYAHLFISLLALGWHVFFLVFLFSFSGQKGSDWNNWNGVYSFSSFDTSTSNVTLNITGTENIGSAGYTVTQVAAFLCTLSLFFDVVYLMGYIVVGTEWDSLEHTRGLQKEEEEHTKDGLLQYMMYPLCLGIILASVWQFIYSVVMFSNDLVMPIGTYFDSMTLVFVAVASLILPVPLKNPPNVKIKIINKLEESYEYTPDTLEERLERTPMSYGTNLAYKQLIDFYAALCALGIGFTMYCLSANQYWTSQNGASGFDVDDLYNTLKRGAIWTGFTNVRYVTVTASDTQLMDIANYIANIEIFNIVILSISLFVMFVLITYILIGRKLRVLYVDKGGQYM